MLSYRTQKHHVSARVLYFLPPSPSLTPPFSPQPIPNCCLSAGRLAPKGQAVKRTKIVATRTKVAAVVVVVVMVMAAEAAVTQRVVSCDAKGGKL